MLTTVSISDFRKNLADYLDVLGRGETVIINNAKRGKSRLVLSAKAEEFDWDEYLTWVKNMKPFLSNESTKTMKKFRSDIDKRFEQARNR